MYAVFDTDLVLLHSCLLSLDGLSAQQMKYTAARILAASPFIVKPVAFSGRIPKWRSTLLYLWHRLYRAKSSHPSPKNPSFTDHRPLTTVFWASGPSALPCAGAAPPQRPALASDRVQSSPAICLANGVSSPTGPVGAGLVPALCPPINGPPLGPGLAPALCLSKCRYSTPAAAGIISPPYCSHSRLEMHPSFSDP